MKHREIEFKYSAADISLKDFQKFCISKDPRNTVIASGYDYFYAHKTDSNSFCRLRSGPDMHQLTFKRKTEDKNNFVRTEHNIDLGRHMTRDQIEAFLSEFSYVPNTVIFKNCYVYNYETYTLVYYICYDENLHELGRYVEIEMSEDFPWKHENDAWNDLLALERLFKPLGVSPQARIKRSLYELFRSESEV